MNLQEYNQPMYGVQEGILYGQNERVDELNERIMSRNTPDMTLAPNFDPHQILAIPYNQSPHFRQ